jgi:hypothetical protein
MWDKHHLDLPSEQNLLWELTRDRGFTDRGATEFIRSYKATIAFAKLGQTQGASAHEALPDTQRVVDGPDEDRGDPQPEGPPGAS